MRKAVAILFSAIIVVPLLSLSLFLFAGRSWVLDADLYQKILGDERLYQSWEVPAAEAVLVIAEDAGVTLDAEATKIGLKAAYSAEELAALVGGATSDFLRVLGETNWESSLSARNVMFKEELLSRAHLFADAYAKAVAAGSPSSSEEALVLRDFSVRPENMDLELWRGAFVALITEGIDQVPDPFRLSVAEGMDLPAFLRRGGLSAFYNFAMLAVAFVAVALWLSSGMMAASLWRERFIWLGSVLGFPAALLIISGTAMMIGGGAAAKIYTGAVPGLAAAAENIAAVLAPFISRIGQSFLISGLSAAGLSAALSSARFFWRDDDDLDEAALEE